MEDLGSKISACVLVDFFLLIMRFMLS